MISLTLILKPSQKKKNPKAAVSIMNLTLLGREIFCV